MSKDKNKLEPQDVLLKEPGIFGIDEGLGESKYNLWRQKNTDNKIIDLKDKFIAILKTQDYDHENNIIIDKAIISEEALQIAKELQIEKNDKNCSDEINKLLGVSTKDDARTKEINMLLAQASKADGADKKLKDFEAKKNEILKHNKQLKEKINNAKTIEEVNNYLFDISTIKPIKSIEEIK